MGLDLRILPVYGNSNFSLTSLECGRDYDLFGVIKEIQQANGRDLSRNGFTGYMADNFQKQETDGYGELLQSVQAKELKQLELLPEDDATNRAILSYIRELKDDCELFLYWH